MAHGRFVWHDLGSGDVPRDLNFYTKLFGWEFSENMGNAGAYHRFTTGDGLGGGLFDQSGPVPAWLAYIHVDDLEDCLITVMARGGTVLMDPYKIPSKGTMALIAGPGGAMITLIELEEPPELPDRSPEAGEFCWYSISAIDPMREAAFWSAVCGWNVEEVDLGGGGKSTTFFRDGKPIAGLTPADDDQDQGYWSLAIVAPGNCAEATLKAKALGATELMPPTPMGEMGTMSVMRDPGGAAFSLWEQKAPTAE